MCTTGKSCHGKISPLCRINTNEIFFIWNCHHLYIRVFHAYHCEVICKINIVYKLFFYVSCKFIFLYIGEISTICYLFDNCVSSHMFQTFICSCGKKVSQKKYGPICDDADCSYRTSKIVFSGSIPVPRHGLRHRIFILNVAISLPAKRYLELLNVKTAKRSERSITKKVTALE